MYNVFLIATSDDQRADSLRTRIASEAQSFGVSVEILEWDDAPSVSERSSATLYLGSVRVMEDNTLVALVDRALELGYPIIPVVEGGHPHSKQLPERLQHLKYVRWSAGEEVPDELIGTVFEVLGIAERERRVFISYRQVDASTVAVQLYHALVEKRFHVFLDRFQTSVAEDIQDRIDEALEDTAFVLLLYTPDMPNSVWVDWEITRALKSRLPVLVVKWTNVSVEIPKLRARDLPTIDFDPDGDVEADRIQSPKLQEILTEIERLHSNGLLRRRRESLTAARRFAEGRGWSVSEEPRWKLLLTRHQSGRNPVVLGVTPRLARTEDLYDLDIWDTPDLGVVGMQWSKIMTQASTDLPPHRSKMLEWVIGTRNIQVVRGTDSLSQVL